MINNFTICVDCGCEVERLLGQRGKKRCAPCNEKWKKAYAIKHPSAPRSKQKNREYGKEYYRIKSGYYKKTRHPIKSKTPIELKEYRHNSYIKRKSSGKLQDWKIKYMQIPQNKIANSLRNRMWSVLKRRSTKGDKYFKMMEVLGCSLSELIRHLEAKFTEGMSWGNYGMKGWWVDHKIPCASFDLTDPEQQRKCFHYTNLQPLWYLDNIKKGDKILQF